MGYEYTIQGWYRSDRPVDLNTFRLADDRYDWAGSNKPDRYLSVTGRDSNYVGLATTAKHWSNYCLTALSEIIASLKNNGFGLVTITGEIPYDGKDRFVIARDGKLLTLPTVRLYDPLSPWNAIYHWSHYMGRPIEELIPADAGLVRGPLAERTSIKGWLYLHDHDTSELDAERLIAGIVERCPDLGGGIAYVNQFLQPNLLFGQHEVDAASAVKTLADVTAVHKRSYGMLYCATPDERSQIPVAFENGRVAVLPGISLAPEKEPNLLPTAPDAYEGLGHGVETIWIRSPLGLHGLARELMQTLQAEPVEPYGGWRERSGGDRPFYMFEAHGLTCFLMSNVGEEHSARPYELTLYLQGPAEPSLLKQKAKELARYLRSGGVEIQVDRTGW